MKKIIMYTGNECGKCKRAKMMIESCPVEVDLELRNVDEDEKYMRELKDVIKSSSLPTIMIPDIKGKYQYEDGAMYKEHIGFEDNLGKIMGYLGL